VTARPAERRPLLQEERSPRPADVDPEDATPNDAGAPAGVPSPLKGPDEDPKGPEKRLDEESADD
jgi:hypothetical protein